jgi:uncharacterized membrane protein
VLVLRAEARLPDACLRCGTSSGNRRSLRKFSWHPPLIYLLAIQPIIYVIAAAIARKTALVAVPLCARHRRLVVLGRTIAWIVVPAGVAAAAYGLAVDSLLASMLGLYAVLAASVFAKLATHVAGVQHIDDHFVRLRGADLRVLDRLPDWDAFEEPSP